MTTYLNRVFCVKSSQRDAAMTIIHLDTGYPSFPEGAMGFTTRCPYYLLVQTLAEHASLDGCQIDTHMYPERP
jgi:hypothetical protein